MATESPARPVGEIVDRLDSATNQPSLSVHDLLEEFGESSFLPALMPRKNRTLLQTENLL